MVNSIVGTSLLLFLLFLYFADAPWDKLASCSLNFRTTNPLVQRTLFASRSRFIAARSRYVPPSNDCPALDIYGCSLRCQGLPFTALASRQCRLLWSYWMLVGGETFLIISLFRGPLLCVILEATRQVSAVVSAQSMLSVVGSLYVYLPLFCCGCIYFLLFV